MCLILEQSSDLGIVQGDSGVVFCVCVPYLGNEMKVGMFHFLFRQNRTKLDFPGGFSSVLLMNKLIIRWAGEEGGKEGRKQGGEVWKVRMKADLSSHASNNNSKAFWVTNKSVEFSLCGKPRIPAGRRTN